MRTRQHLVVIGNSGAAIHAVKGIRSVNSECLITLISREAQDAYSPVLTSYLIAGKITRSQMALADGSFYHHHRVECRYKQKVLSLNAAEKKVFLEDGSFIDYDKVLIASGAFPNPLDCSWPAGAPVFTLRTIADAERIRNCISRGRKVLFAGAGLVSLQVANALGKASLQMTFVVGSDQILSLNLDRRAAALIQRRVEAEGGEFLFGQEIREVKEGKRGIVAHTDKGQAFEADALIVGKGVRPNIPELLPGGIVQVGEGIRVNRQLQTTAEDIYAAGDVCEAVDLISREYRVIANWPNACLQGQVAGQNMAGRVTLFPGSLSMNVTSLFGISFASIGHVRDVSGEKRETAFYTNEARGIYKKWVFKDDRMIGAILLGDLGEVPLTVQAIRGQKPMAHEKEALMNEPARAARFLHGLLQT